MWGVLVQLAVWAAIYVGNKLLTPKPKHKPLTRENVELPRTEEGSPVPLVFGRTRVQSPLLIWNSNLQTKTVDNSNNGAQYNVFAVDLLFCVGIPMGSGVTRGNSLAGPRLHKVWLGDNLLPKPIGGSLPSAGTSAIRYSQMVFRPQLLGGPGNGGGLIGAYSWLGGYTDQSVTSPASRIGDMMTTDFGGSGDIPGYRRQMLLSLHKYPKDSSDPYFASTGGDGGSGTHAAVPYPERGFILGESPNVDGISCEVSCYGDGGSGSGGFSMNGANPGVDFGGCADPIEVIYDLMTNPWGRAGVPSTKVDTASFSAASATLKSEGHGWSGVVYDASDVANKIQEILRQINAAYYEEPTTGKMVIKLIRNDFNPLTVPAYTEDNIVSIEDFGVGGFKETINEVRVVYTDRSAEYKPGIAVAQSLANAVGNNNRRRSRTIEYPGIHNATLAASVAARDLNVLSRPLARIKLTLDRTASNLRPGSVFKVTYAKYPAMQAGMYFRVKSMDPGQLFSNKVVVEAVQDPFVSTYQGLGADWQPPNRIDPYPLHDRTITEAPRWLVQEAANSGLVSDVDATHLLPMPRPSKNATQFQVKTRQLIVSKNNDLFVDWQTDIPLQDFPASFTVATPYARELEPYDTTTGMIIEAISGVSQKLLSGFYGKIFGTGTAIFSATAAQIQNEGRNLICVTTASGAQEFMAFESMTDIGGGRYRLNNVWRGLMDTPAIAHDAGERGVWISANMVSRRGWSILKTIHLLVTPRAPQFAGSGEDPEDTYVVSKGAIRAGVGQNLQGAARAILPLPLTDLAVGNDGVMKTGTHAAVSGLPSVAGYYKSFPLLEEEINFVFRRRDRFSAKLVRGDTTDDTNNEWSASTFQYNPAVARQGSTFPFPFNSGTITVNDGPTSFSPTNPASPSVGWKIDGYGMLDLGMEYSRALGAGDPQIGKGGLGLASVLIAWDAPRVTANMPSWRNLLANVRWTLTTPAASISTVDNWNAFSPSAGFATVVQSSTSVYATATGKYLGAATNTTVMSRGQNANVSNWKPRGLTALGSAYVRNLNADVDDTAQVGITAYNSGISVGSSFPAATVPPNATWKRYDAQLVLPTNTNQVGLGVTTTRVGANATANGIFDETELRIGQFVASNNSAFATASLANPSFETGTTASWTVASGTWGAVGVVGPSANAAQITNAGNGQIYQEYTLPNGAEYGSTAFVTIWFKQSAPAQGTFKATVAAMDSGSNVLASADTGSTNTATNEWKKFTVFVQIPDGATKVRVTVDATYISGANPSVLFDDVNLTVVKDQAPRITRTLDWSAPSKQDMPATWQQFALTLPTAIGRYADFYRGYPRTPAQMSAAVTWDTIWAAGWLFDELSSPCPTTFAQVVGATSSTSYSFATSGGAPTFAAAGPRGYPDRAVQFTGTADAMTAGNIFQAGSLDFLIAGTIRFDSFANAGVDVLGKNWAGSAAPGWVLVREGTALKMYVSDGVTQASVGATGLVVNTWYAFLVSVNRTTSNMRVFAVPLDNYQTATMLGSGISIAGMGSFANSGQLKLGAQVYNQTQFTISSLYMSEGTGVCGSMGSNTSSALRAFASSVSPALDVPTYVFGGEDFNGEQVEWTDGIPHSVAKVVGQFGNNVSSVNGYQFSRGTGAAAIHAAAKWSTKSTVGNFKLSDPFTAVVFFKVDEPGLSTIAGLFGRMDLTAGWGLYISAAGQVTALLRGAGATSVSVSTGRVASEGGLRMAALVNDPSAGLLWVYDEFGGVATVTVSAGLGAIDRIAQACHLRIGRDVDDHDVLPGQVARAYLWKAALTASEIKALWNYAKDPNNKITTYTRTAAAYAIGPSDSDGATAYVVGANQIAIPYTSALTADSGSGYGLAVGKSITNLVPNVTFNSANWALDAGAGRVLGKASPTGTARAVQISGNASNSIVCNGLSLAASPSTVTVVFVARLISGGPNLTLKLRNSSHVVKSTSAAQVLTSLWQRFTVILTGWDASTATGEVEFNPSSGTTVWELAECVSMSQGNEIPLLIPFPSSTHGNYNALIDTTKTYDAALPVQFNSEGEIIAQGVSMNNPPFDGTLVQVKNASTDNNRRELLAVNSTGFRLRSWDGAAVAVNSEVAYTTFATRVWRAVGRWNRFGMLDVSGGAAEFAKAAYTDNITTTNQYAATGRSAIFSLTTVASTQILIGAGTASPCDTALRKLIVQAREEKYD